jgi:ATP-dependent DNA helicase RecG
LVTADVEGEVSNTRMRLVSDQHPADLTKMLQRLVVEGFLVRSGQGRWTVYRLPGADTTADDSPLITLIDSSRNEPGSPRNEPGSPHNEPGSPHNEPGSPQDFEGREPLPPEEEVRLLEIARPARERQRRTPEMTRQAILDLCDGRFLSAAQLARLIDRDPEKVVERFLSPMVDEGLLRLRYPSERRHPQQAYSKATDSP